ncbi:type 4a pilus biogenesis protein PilO [Dehalobacter sp. TBBPA1]|uniref:type 4a pilus biogenesis protein PilO n=1 Tax=Dehalobacter sp. TBBPA1 TaxID=3235037 RepID=UPI0034A24AA5
MRMKKNGILITGLIILLGIGYVYLLVGQFGVLQKNSAQLREREAYLVTLQNNYINLSGLKQEQTDLTTQAAELDLTVPKNLVKPDMMVFIFNLAKDSGINSQNLTFEEMKDEGSYSSLAMNFSCTGPTAKIYAFVERLRKVSQYNLALDSIQVTEGEEDTAAARIRIIAYGYKE